MISFVLGFTKAGNFCFGYLVYRRGSTVFVIFLLCRISNCAASRELVVTDPNEDLVRSLSSPCVLELDFLNSQSFALTEFISRGPYLKMEIATSFPGFLFPPFALPTMHHLLLSQKPHSPKHKRIHAD